MSARILCTAPCSGEPIGTDREPGTELSRPVRLVIDFSQSSRSAFRRPRRSIAKRSNLAGWAGYGYCASHPRSFWGLRLHLVCTPSGLPITLALANPKADERDVALDMFDHDPTLFNGPSVQTIVADKGYASREFETRLADHSVELVRPAPETLTETTRSETVETCPSDRRIGLRHPERPAQPGTTRWAQPTRCPCPGSPTTPRNDRRDPAQPPHWPTRPTLTDRLRPLTNHGHSPCFKGHP